MVLFREKSSKKTTPFQCHHTDNITFWDGGAFFHDLLRVTLLYTIHFSSPVTIRLKNNSLLSRFSNESQMERNPLHEICFCQFMGNPNIKFRNITEFMQFIFHARFGNPFQGLKYKTKYKNFSARRLITH